MNLSYKIMVQNTIVLPFSVSLQKSMTFCCAMSGTDPGLNQGQWLADLSIIFSIVDVSQYA